MNRAQSALLLALLSSVLIGVYAYANPATAICLLSSNEPASYTPEQRDALSTAKNRLTAKFGKIDSTPIITFFNDPASYWPLRPNVYGSTSFIGKRICILIGPKGQNTDVLAHELVHSEVAARLGYWRRLTQLPVWFDEGLAMQVDLRSGYSLAEAGVEEARNVTNLWYSWDFFVVDTQQLTRHYSAAKSVVSKWIDTVGSRSVYSLMERIRAGEDFHAVITDDAFESG